MRNDDEPIFLIVCIYAGFNLIVRIARLAFYGVALWVAFEPGGSILAGIIIFLIAGAINTISYGEDAARHKR